MAELIPLQVDPDVLNFSPPLNRVINNSFILTNTTANQVIYKVKTTAPKRYVVRPNFGVVPPSGSVEVQVTLHYSKDPPATLDKTKDRFLVQSTLLPENLANPDLKALWTEAENADQVAKVRIRCTFQHEGVSAPSESDAPGVSHPSEGAPAPDAGAPSGSAFPLRNRQLEDLSDKLTRAEADRDHLKDELVRLKAKLAQREKESAAAAVRGQPAGGFNPKVLLHYLIVAFVSFLIAYFKFSC